MLHGEIEVDDTRVGEGYGMPTQESREAQELAAQTEALFVDHTYTAKALGALIAYIRRAVHRGSDRSLLAHRRSGRAVRVRLSRNRLAGVRRT